MCHFCINAAEVLRQPFLQRYVEFEQQEKRIQAQIGMRKVLLHRERERAVKSENQLHELLAAHAAYRMDDACSSYHHGSRKRPLSPPSKFAIDSAESELDSIRKREFAMDVAITKSEQQQAVYKSRMERFAPEARRHLQLKYRVQRFLPRLPARVDERAIWRACSAYIKSASNNIVQDEIFKQFIFDLFGRSRRLYDMWDLPAEASLK
eukprot:6208101-Pleurochrysis_carterae.AAC.3